MQLLRVILTPLVAAAVLAAGAPLVQAQNRGDDTLLEMQQAFRKGDRKKLEQLLPAVRGHALEPWAAYWELKARLNEATSQEVQAFMQRRALVGQMLQRARWRQRTAEMYASRLRQWPGIRHCRPKSREIVGVDQA